KRSGCASPPTPTTTAPCNPPRGVAWPSASTRRRRKPSTSCHPLRQSAHDRRPAMFSEYLHYLIYGYYPYLAGTVFLVGSLLRFDHGQYTWKAHSSQILSQQNMRLASNLFHVGMLVIFFGHLFGMLTPHWIYSPFISADNKQLLAIIVGGVAGAMVVIGGGMLLYRRFFNPRVKATSGFMDNLILALIVFQAALGMVTIIFSLGHL